MPAPAAVPPADTGPTWAQFLASLADPHLYERVGVHAVKIILICVIAGIVSRIGTAIVARGTNGLIEKDERRANLSGAARHRTLAGLLRSCVKYGVYFFAFISIIATWNLHILGLLGTAGVLGVVVGFGAQKLVRDVITGILMLVEDQYTIGDTVTIGTVTGVVEDIGIRVTRIRDEIGRLNILPHGDISQVTNHSRGRLDAAIEVSVPFDQDLDKVKEAVAAASAKVQALDDSPVQGSVTVEGITALDGTKMTLRIGAGARSGHQKAAEMSLREAVREEFLAAGIKLV